MPFFVYLITNTVNGKRYVGKTKNVSRRWMTHIQAAKRGSGLLLHRAIRKYRAEHFKVEVLHRCDTDAEALALEVDEIARLATRSPHGYNLTAGGEGLSGLPSSRRLDLTGQAFGRLTVLRQEGKTKRSGLAWRCRCTCGSESVTSSANLRSGVTKSCGCLSRDRAKELPKQVPEDMTGMRFGNLCALRLAPSKRNRVAWYCTCNCDGHEIIVTAMELKSGDTKSCGCKGKPPLTFGGTRVTVVDLARIAGVGVTTMHYRISKLGMTPEQATIIRKYTRPKATKAA